MKTKLLTLILFSLLMTMGMTNCSKNDFDPDDCFTSILTGEYGKSGLYHLYVTENGVPLDDYGYVRFDSKDLTVADFRFVKVIPGVSKKEFKNVPLIATEEGIKFTIEYTQKNHTVSITGIVDFGEMSIDINVY